MEKEAQYKTHFASAERCDKAELQNDISLVYRNPVIDGLLHTVSGLLAVLNKHRQILAINDALLKSLGISDAEQLLGQKPGEALHCIHSDEMPGGCGTSQYCSTCGAAIAIVASITSNTPQERKCVLTIIKNDTVNNICFRVKACPIHADSNNSYILLFLQDITKEEWRASIEKVFFHDLNNIIGGLVGISELMSYDNNGYAHKLISPMQNLIKRLDNEVRIQGILSRTNISDYCLITDKLCFGDIKQEINDTFMNHPVAKDKGLNISSTPSDFTLVTDVRWKKWTPKSDKIQRRRCQDERYTTRTLHEGVSGRSSEDGNRWEHMIAGGSASAIITALDFRELGQGA